jgi:predicted nucleotidyltransferase component of viral defense system
MYTMLTQQQAQKFAQEQQTVVDNIIKEHYQVYILDQLFKAPFEQSLVFKGGTALRLAYNSVRYSEDLDFSLTDQISYDDFKKTIKNIVRIFPESKIQDIYDKYSTLYAKIVFSVAYKPIPIGVKIEINKGTKDFKHTIALLHSPFNNIEVASRVYTLESILKDKLSILETKSRHQARDLFDAWYISQKLHREFEIKQDYKFSKKEVMDGLNPLLPKNNAKVMELFIVT